MLFIYPMWDNESQRIGKQKCTPMGYNLNVIAEPLGFIGLLLLLGVCVHLGCSAVTSAFDKSLFWLITILFGFSIISRVFYQFSWFLASRRGFEYDYEKREASWIENGESVTYRYKSPDRPSE